MSHTPLLAAPSIPYQGGLFFLFYLNSVVWFPGFLRRSRHPVSSSSDTFTSIQSMGAEKTQTDTLRWSTDLNHIIGLEGIYKYIKSHKAHKKRWKRNAVSLTYHRMGCINSSWQKRTRVKTSMHRLIIDMRSTLMQDAFGQTHHLAAMLDSCRSWVTAKLSLGFAQVVCTSCERCWTCLLCYEIFLLVLPSNWIFWFLCTPVWTLHFTPQISTLPGLKITGLSSALVGLVLSA